MKSILIIEDENDLQKALRIRFETEGLRTYPAESAAEGLEVALEKRPDLILMDVILPGEMDGYQATYWVKHNDFLKDTPVVILTVKASRQDRMYAFRSGADAYITKPYDHEDLIEKIKSLLSEAPAFSEQR